MAAVLAVSAANSRLSAGAVRSEEGGATMPSKYAAVSPAQGAVLGGGRRHPDQVGGDGSHARAALLANQLLMATSSLVVRLLQLQSLILGLLIWPEPEHPKHRLTLEMSVVSRHPTIALLYHWTRIRTPCVSKPTGVAFGVLRNHHFLRRLAKRVL